MIFYKGGFVDSKMTNSSTKKAWLEYAARIGYSARSVIYLCIGGLALLSVWGGSNGKTTDSKGAISFLSDSPFGLYLVLILGLGLVCYSVWRISQSLWDVDHHGSEAKGIAIRAGLFISALTHGALAVYCFKIVGIVTSSGSSSGSGGKKETLGSVMSLPYGQWIAVAIGAIVVGFGISQLVKAYKETYKKHIDFPGDHKILDGVSKAGLTARAVIFIVIGVSAVYAGLQTDPSEMLNFSEVWSKAGQTGYSAVAVTLLAMGLFLFGVYSGIEARYRKVQV